MTIFNNLNQVVVLVHPINDTAYVTCRRLMKFEKEVYRIEELHATGGLDEIFLASDDLESRVKGDMLSTLQIKRNLSNLYECIAGMEISLKHSAALEFLATRHVGVVAKKFADGNKFILGRNTAYALCKELGYGYNPKIGLFGKWEQQLGLYPKRQKFNVGDIITKKGLGYNGRVVEFDRNNVMIVEWLKWKNDSFKTPEFNPEEFVKVVK